MQVFWILGTQKLITSAIISLFLFGLGVDVAELINYLSELLGGGVGF